MLNSSADRDPLERLAEEFLERHRRGEHPSLTEYADRLPDQAEEIRDLFPALVLMERAKPADGDVTGTFMDAAESGRGRVPERLGDFRILREIGRGGMGIVFEADQESLGRHVALKVLPSHALLNPRHLQRFLREARAAARLHHTNIVPVFGVGESDGLHYYAMQFIAGSGLNDVVDELRRLSAGNPPAAALSVPGPPRLQPTRPVNVALGLLTGQFKSTLADSPADRDASGNGHLSKSNPDVLAGSAILSGSGRNFAREVARVGQQVAEALDYAHGQGVLHRDIKPSNLLLDVQGTVWVADFGLAKALADGDDLTNEGDVLGTLRYMAPERFRGQSDSRSDLYALGLTLYELLTLRPAFDQEDRDRLIHQVTTGVPPRPRTINSAIPRDLETIILKAIEHDPARRYQDAQALAADLERFLADQPIRARSVGALERGWKWAQRKPAVAALLAALALALVVGFGGVTWQWRHAVAARDEARINANKARTNFVHALDTVNTFCTFVSEEELLDQPGMQPLRRRLLELALAYFRKFRTEQGDDPTLMRELAETSMRSGIISNELGDAVEAHLLLLKAKDILIALVRERPNDVRLRLLLAHCYIEIADADRMSDIATQSLVIGSGMSDAAPLIESLLKGDPGNPEYLRLLGRAQNMSAVVYMRMGRDSTSRSVFGKAIAALELAGKVAPDDAIAGHWLALAYSDLGELNQQTGRCDEQIIVLGRAQALFDALERRYPRSRRHRLDRAAGFVRLGMARIEVGQFGVAAGLLNEARDRLEVLFQENRDSVDARYWLATATRGLGEVALARRETAASAILRRAIEIRGYGSDSSHSGRDQIEQAWTYAWLAQAELAAGHTAAVPELRVQFDKLIGAIKSRSLVGSNWPYQPRELARINAFMEPICAAAEKATISERINAGRARIEAVRARAAKQPENPTLRFEVASALILLADVLEQAGDLEGARFSLDRALELLGDPSQDDPNDFRWLHGRARVWESFARLYLRSKHPKEARDAASHAVAIIEALTRADSAYSYDLACVLGLRGELTSTEADAAAAIASLRRAIAGGFDNEHLLRTDPRLATLRGRSGFPGDIGSAK